MADAEPRASKPVLRRKPPAGSNGWEGGAQQDAPAPPPPTPAQIPRDYVDPELAALTTPEKCGLYLAKTRKTMADLTGDPTFLPTRETVQVGGPLLSLGLRHSRAEWIVGLVRRSPYIAMAVVALVLGIVLGIPTYIYWRRREAARRRDEPYIPPEPAKARSQPPPSDPYARDLDNMGHPMARGLEYQDGSRPTGQSLGVARSVG